MNTKNGPDRKRAVFSFGDDEDDDDRLIQSVQPLPEQVVERSAFVATDFHPDRFLSSRRHLGLETLKTELNGHLKLLKTELVELINRDYQDFINLSTNLKGVDKAIDDLKKPLIRMELQVQDVRTHFQQVIDTLEQQLEHRTEVEDLLEINADVPTTSLVVEGGDGVPIDDSLGKQIERVAIEFNQMQHLVGRGKHLPFVIENEWRIARIKETLQHKLSRTLTTALSRLPSDESKSSLLQCLRTYALIDQTHIAECLIREKYVRPFLTKTITRKAIESPRMNGSLTATDNPLTTMYGKILTFVSKDMCPILEVTRRTLKGTNYEVLVNSLWVEVTWHYPVQKQWRNPLRDAGLTKRYNLWASRTVEHLLAATLTEEKDKSSVPSRPSTPIGNIQELGIVDETTALKQLVMLVHDIEILVEQTKTQTDTVILPKLPVNVHEIPLLRECINDILLNLVQSSIPEANKRITGIVNRRCMESLKLVRSITSQYRHTNKPPPTESSYFIPNLFRPFLTFVEQHSSWINDGRRKIWGRMVGEAIVTRYTTIVTELLINLKKTEDSLKKLKKGKKNAVKPILGGNSGDVAMTDEDKIRLQIFLDVQRIGEELSSLAIDKTNFECYDKLYEFVQPFGKQHDNLDQATQMYS
ncbi:Conserved oligomeric Golgi complex subunit 2 [Apophysomyces sp. BC1034]|nr:Conserved oligomeric Golgi complex subunit 2 [Apophysomyces sp. BC1034]